MAKDGYELRYGEPEGGITLWDLAADESVYVFGPDVVSGAEQPEGVREVDDGETWTALPLPEASRPLAVDAYGDRWVLVPCQATFGPSQNVGMTGG